VTARHFQGSACDSRANIPFGQVVVEGGFEVIHEGENFAPAMVEAFVQVSGLGLFSSHSFF
jgi:hypothetical protein